MKGWHRVSDDGVVDGVVEGLQFVLIGELELIYIRWLGGRFYFKHPAPSGHPSFRGE